MADKSFRRTIDNTFEAIGNVIVTHGQNSIYGEFVKIDFAKGKADVHGSVRYSGRNVTLYGSHAEYDFFKETIAIKNARIFSDNYVVFGKLLKKIGEKEYVAEDAEYTTCHDCPESWSIAGENVKITLGQYVSIKHAFLKIKGVVMMYLPYIIFPIKTKRESGLLFPKFSFNLEEGVSFQQPFFWAINNSSDMTLTPSIWGVRGPGGEFEYRYYYNQMNWLKLNSLIAFDSEYKKNLGSNENEFRHFSFLEAHSSLGERFNSHLYLTGLKDLDVLRDFDEQISSNIKSSDLGVDFFLETGTSFLAFGIEGAWKRNILVPGPYEFDDYYVQTIPQIFLNVGPFHLIQTNYPFIRKISFGIDSEYSIFKQNHYKKEKWIRNANRLNFNPYLSWNLGSIGPFNFLFQSKWDSQNYRFPYEKENKTYRKKGILYESSMNFATEKVYGQTDYKKILLNEDKKTNEIFSPLNSPFIGGLPNQLQYDEKFSIETKSSYRHVQDFKLRHLFLDGQKGEGNFSFEQQISEESGQFDFLDVLRSKKGRTYIESPETTLPIENVLDFQWNHTLVKKSPKTDSSEGQNLLENFDYLKMAHLNISQGLDLHVETKNFDEKLTRLYIDFGGQIKSYSFSFKDYYFYLPKKHIFSTNLSFSYDRLSLNVGYVVNSFKIPSDKNISFDGVFKLNDLLTFDFKYDYDIDEQANLKRSLGVLYTPKNRCWLLKLNYEKDLIDQKFSFNFYLNYNENAIEL